MEYFRLHSCVREACCWYGVFEPYISSCNEIVLLISYFVYPSRTLNCQVFCGFYLNKSIVTLYWWVLLMFPEHFFWIQMLSTKIILKNFKLQSMAVCKVLFFVMVEPRFIYVTFYDIMMWWYFVLPVGRLVILKSNSIQVMLTIMFFTFTNARELTYFLTESFFTQFSYM